MPDNNAKARDNWAKCILRYVRDLTASLNRYGKAFGGRGKHFNVLACVGTEGGGKYLGEVIT